ncbi:ABC transporter ATP-binding protein, partial [bacterium]|nr:ABC transporter ATP-binding protein [bacterium]
SVYNYCDSATIMYLGDIVEENKCSILFKNPLHPYTKALLNALPNERGKKLQNIKGTISPITDIIAGCKFHPRCDFVMDKCKTQKPFLTDNCACFLCSK